MTVRIDGFEVIEIAGDDIPADLLVWRRYRTRARGIFEAFLDLNPLLAEGSRVSPFMQVGLQVRIPINSDLMKNRPQPIATRTVWGEANQYKL